MPDADTMEWAAIVREHELGVSGARVVCRDAHGREVTPVPPEVLASGAAYPAWVVLEHPGDTTVALGALERLQVIVRGRRGGIVQRCELLADGLPIAHRARFLEYSARELQAYRFPRRTVTALFDVARAVERALGLPPDVDEWIRAHLEFGAAGALSVGAIRSFVAEIPARRAPREALQAFLELVVRCVAAGTVVWSDLPNQLALLVEAAEEDLAVVQRGLVGRVLAAPGFGETPGSVLRTWRPALVELARSDVAIRARLLEFFPVAEGVDAWWFELLDECGALDALSGRAAGGAVPPDGAAGWLARAVWHPNLNDTLRHRRSRRIAPPPDALIELIGRMSATLIADDIPVRLNGPDSWSEIIDLRVLEACLAHGVPVALPAAGPSLGVAHWLQWRRVGEGLPATCKHPEFGPELRKLLALPQYAELLGEETVAGPGEARPALAAASVLDVGLHVTLFLYGFIDRPFPLSASDLARSIRSTAQQMTLPHPASSSLSSGDLITSEWCGLLGRIDGVALRAAAASTRSARRDMLLALLELWADTPFADPDARIRRGVAETAPRLVGDANGVARATHLAGENRCGFIDLRFGDAPPPELGLIEEIEDVHCGWGTATRIRELVRLVRERGPAPWRRRAPKVLAEDTGLSVAAATLLLAGIPGIRLYPAPFLDGTERKVLGVSSKAAAKAAADELLMPSQTDRLDLFAGALPADPAELWTEAGMLEVAGRIAGSWKAWGAAPPPGVARCAP